MAEEFVSILVPTYNRREILLESLDSIERIEIPAGVKVEVIVVANACTDGTEDAVKSRIAAGYRLPIRCVVEPVSGHSRARNRAMAEASGEIFAFLDDDVQVDRDWLVGMLQAYRDYPADVVGGRVDLWWKSITRPDWLPEVVDSLLGRVNFGDRTFEAFSVEPIIGCNMSFRRCVVDAVGPFSERLGRNREGQMGGDETDFIFRVLRTRKYRIFHAPAMRIRHLVPEKRVTVDYLRPGAYALGKSFIFALDHFGFHEFYRRGLRNLVRVVKYSLLEAAAVVRGDRKARLRSQFLRWQAEGEFAGAWRRALAPPRREPRLETGEPVVRS